MTASLYEPNAAEITVLQQHGWRWDEDTGFWVRKPFEEPMTPFEAKEWLEKLKKTS